MAPIDDSSTEVKLSIADLHALLAETSGQSSGNNAYASGDIARVLVSTALVFFMIPGVGYFYSGLTGRRNALSMILLSLIFVAIVSVEWWLWGFSLAFSKTSTNPFIGNLDNAQVEVRLFSYIS